MGVLLWEGQDHRRGVVKPGQITDIERDLSVRFKASERNLTQLTVDAGNRGLKLILEDEVATDAVKDHRTSERHATDLLASTPSGFPASAAVPAYVTFVSVQT